MHALAAKLFGKMFVGKIIFCDHQQAAGVFVETMDDAGPLFAKAHGKLIYLCDQGIDESVLRMAGRWIHH